VAAKGSGVEDIGLGADLRPKTLRKAGFKIAYQFRARLLDTTIFTREFEVQYHSEILAGR
jgi:hypothetical protein